jgi:hypothetical protein
VPHLQLKAEREKPMSSDTVIESVRADMRLVVSERLSGMPSTIAGVEHTSFPFQVERLEADLDDPDQHAAETLTFAADPITVDLTNVLGLRGRFSATGRGLVMIKAVRISGAGDLLIDGTDTDGYSSLNAGKTVLVQGGGMQLFFGEPLSAVSSSSKELVCTGTSGAVWALEFVFGEASEPSELPTADAHMRVYHGTHKAFSETFGVATATWAGAFSVAIFTVWRGNDDTATGGPGDDGAVINPADLDELESGESTSGAGTYTLKEMQEHVFDRLLEAHPDQVVGLYMAAGYYFAPQYLFDGYQFVSVYPKGHVRWSDAFGRSGGATGFAVDAAAISSMANSGGFLQITFGSGQTIPTGSIIDIAGTTEAGDHGCRWNDRDRNPDRRCLDRGGHRRHGDGRRPQGCRLGRRDRVRAVPGRLHGDRRREPGQPPAGQGDLPRRERASADR